MADDGLAIVRRARTEGNARIAILTDTDIDLPSVRVPHAGEWLSPIVFIVAAQLFTLHAAHVAGIDPESPRGLSKVTMTT